jgi:DNA-binding MarR family transcriptional regulator
MPPMRSRPEHDHDTPFGRLDEGSLAGIVGYQLAQATIATSQVFADLVGKPLELRPVEFTVLALIDRNPDLSATQLARALAVTSPNIKMWIDRLEGRGLVERTRSEADRRAQHLRATARGVALIRRAAQRVTEGERAALSALSTGELAILVELLHKVAKCRQRV